MPASASLRRICLFALLAALLFLAVAGPAMAAEEAQHPVPAGIFPEPTLIPPARFSFRNKPCESQYCEGRHVVECFEGKEVVNECLEPEHCEMRGDRAVCAAPA
ncbi:hypothetical protein DFJ74DRAFT_462362 [Hyaloraphidium curvatum]|nr:hypothetical protein DFJ74DRAFT_462362 [Hyaloraphidium curvatum]